MWLPRVFLRAWSSSAAQGEPTLTLAAARLRRSAEAAGTMVNLSSRAAAADLTDVLQQYPHGRQLTNDERANLCAVLTVKSLLPQAAPPWLRHTHQLLTSSIASSDAAVLAQLGAAVPHLNAAQQSGVASYLGAMIGAGASSLHRQRAAQWLAPAGKLQRPPAPFVDTPAFCKTLTLKPQLATHITLPPKLGQAGRERLCIAGQVAYEMAPAFAHGAYGAVYRGVDAKGGAVVLKRQFVGPLGSAAAAAEATLAAAQGRAYPVKQVVDEATIGREVAYLKAAGARTAPIDVIKTADSYYLVMTSWPGVLTDALKPIHDSGHGAALGRHVLLSGAQALHAAHVAGVVHHDIKPDNFLADAKGTLSLADFGRGGMVATHLPGAIALHLSVGGTHGYLGPEFFAAGPMPVTTDMFGLGVCWLAAVTGQAHSPFSGSGKASSPAEFAAWHDTLPRDETGSIAFVPPKSDGDGWDAVFAGAFAADAPMAAYVLEHMLDPDPHRRHTAADVAKHVTDMAGTQAAVQTAKEQLGRHVEQKSASVAK